KLSPYAMDVREITVGVVRHLVAENPGLAPIMHGTDPSTIPCKYLGPADPTNDDEPVNCVTHDLAARICKALGNKRLPTEAEWEYAAGNRDKEDDYPWGDDGDACKYA